MAGYPLLSHFPTVFAAVALAYDPLLLLAVLCADPFGDARDELRLRWPSPYS